MVTVHISQATCNRTDILALHLERLLGHLRSVEEVVHSRLCVHVPVGDDPHWAGTFLIVTSTPT